MKKVIIYTSPTCAYCKMAKDFFKKHKIKYSEKEITKNLKDAHKVFEKVGVTATPIKDIEGELVVGFNEVKLKKLLGV